MDQILSDKFRTIVQMHRMHLQEFMTQYNIYLGQHRVLFSLEDYPDITLTKLSEILQVSKESLSVSIKRLENSGHVNKRMDKNDKRSCLLSLSDKGLMTARACRKEFQALNASMFEGIKDKDNLLSDFNIMIKNLERK